MCVKLLSAMDTRSLSPSIISGVIGADLIASLLARQIWPPGIACSSMMIVWQPWLAAIIPAFAPAGPAPIIATSQVSIMV